MLQNVRNRLPALLVYGLAAQSTGGGSEPLVRSSESSVGRETQRKDERTEGCGGQSEQCKNGDLCQHTD